MAIHIKMGHESDELGTHSVGEHVMFGQLARQVLRGHARATDVADQDVGLHLRWIDLNTGNLRQAFGEEARVGVVLLQPPRALLPAR